MESPLNRAHQWARKADDLTEKGKYEEAIVCHNRASEHMLETLQTPGLNDSPSLVTCLCLQHEHHLRQVKVLQVKQLRQAGVEARRSRPVKMRSKSIQTDSVSTLPHRAASSRHQNVLVNTQDIQESIREADTMLRYLKLRKDDPEVPLPWEEKEEEEVKQSSEQIFDAKKNPKDDKMVVEELRCLTEELREHIVLLVRESECLKLENQGLQKKTPETEQLEPLEGFQTTHFTNSSSFNLPPLEMPDIQLPPKLSSDSEDEISDRM